MFLNQFANVKLHCIHGNPLCDFKILGAYMQKNINISTATHPRTVNLVSNKSSDIALLYDGWICKLVILNFHECS